MMKYINIGLLVLLVILGVSLFNTCGKLKEIKNDTILVITTKYIPVKDSGKTKPIYINSIKYVDRPFFKTDTGNVYVDTSKEENPCQSINKAYMNLFDSHYAKNIFADTIPIDTIGKIFIKDTVFNNRVIGRSFILDVKYPVTTIDRTVTITKPRKAAVLLGVGIVGNKLVPLAGFDVNVAFQNKKGNIIELRGLTIENQIYIGAGFKIKL